MEDKILVVDDDKLLLQTMTKVLQQEGYSVTAVDNGHKAIDTIKQVFYDLIVLDIRMPDIDGIQALKEIREIQAEEERSVVIIVTGYASEDAPIKAIKFGAADYILKPFELSDFLYIINRNMRIARLEREKREYILEVSETNKELQDTLIQLQGTQEQLLRSNEELRKSKEKIEEYSKTLEEKVQERTKELKATQTQLVQSAKMSAIGQLGAGVAHELNNPLGGIFGYAQFILDKMGRPGFGAEEFKSCQKYIESIERESARCKSIVENLLNFSRRPIFAKPKPLDVRKSVEDTFALLGHQLKINNIKIVSDFKPDLAKVMGNTNQLQQVFTNLVLNAQQAMPRGGELRVVAENIIDEKTQAPKGVKIEISDTGCGIPEEDKGRIFEPFFTTKGDDKGIGLGLSVSYQIIKEHNGTIEVDSKVGEGSRFTITLPVREGKES